MISWRRRSARSEWGSGPDLKPRTWRRLTFRVAILTSLLGCLALYKGLSTAGAVPQGIQDSVPSRFLQSTMVSSDQTTADCTQGDECLKEGLEGMIVLYLVGVLYMFIALAVVCDEFFVPALEVFVDKFDISMDVAGATFMAAGGSAPELFTSFIGTFKESDVGFGTIVGSAVFNVLFVIGVCAVASKDPLELTWWPLARDVSYYCLSLLTLVIFFGFTSKQEIELWEAIVLLLLYGGYVTFMKFNERLYQMITRHETADDVKPMEDPNNPVVEAEGHADANFNKPSTFRAGILTLLMQNEDIIDTAGIAAVSKVTGNMKETFDYIDKDKSGFIEVHELGELLKLMGLGTESSNGETCPQYLATAMRSLDRTGDDKISFEEFKKWYISSEARVEVKMRQMFDKFDVDGDKQIDCKEMKNLLRSMGHHVTDDEVQNTVGQISKSKSTVIQLDEFADWYHKSLFWDKQIHEFEMQQTVVEHAAEGMDLVFPWNGNLRAKFWYVVTYPICALLFVTMPDVRREGYDTTCMAVMQFAMSIGWIGFFSFCMVDWVTIAAYTIGIPVSVAGVTILAAGTSVPDMLSSYIVAQQGEGDMAVSSSIGSNIFDVTVGLPLPWLCYNIYYGKPVKVVAKSLGFSILVLLMMLVAVITIVKLWKWKMHKSMGYGMFCLYGIFLLQDLLQQFPTDGPVFKTPEF